MINNNNDNEVEDPSLCWNFGWLAQSYDCSTHSDWWWWWWWWWWWGQQEYSDDEKVCDDDSDDCDDDMDDDNIIITIYIIMIGPTLWFRHPFWLMMMGGGAATTAMKVSVHLEIQFQGRMIFQQYFIFSVKIYSIFNTEHSVEGHFHFLEVWDDVYRHKRLLIS